MSRQLGKLKGTRLIIRGCFWSQLTKFFLTMDVKLKIQPFRVISPLALLYRAKFYLQGKDFPIILRKYVCVFNITEFFN